MPKKRRPARPAPSLRKQFARIQRTFDERGDLIAELQRTTRFQFERIAQMQVQIDNLERAVRTLTDKKKAGAPSL